MPRRDLTITNNIKNILSLLSLFLMVATATAAEPPKNIVLILADDLGWADTTLSPIAPSPSSNLCLSPIAIPMPVPDCRPRLPSDCPAPEWETIKLEEAVCEKRLGGVIKSMCRGAA